MYSADCGLADSHELTPEIFCSWNPCSWPTHTAHATAINQNGHATAICTRS